MSKKLTYSYVKSFIENEGHQLLSKEYKNNHTKLTIKCPKDHINSINFSNFRQGQRCFECNKLNLSKKFSFNYDYIKNFIEKEGYQLLSSDYVNAHIKLLVKCPLGHEYKVKFNNFQQGQRCFECNKLKLSKIKKYTYKYVKDYIEKEDYQLLSNNYTNSNHKLLLSCPKYHKFKMSFNSFKNQNYRCPICWYESKSSKQEKEIQDYIEAFGYNIIRNDRTQIINPLTGKNLELDVWIPELNKAIEYNGTYWHKKLDKIKKDQIKIDQCKEKGIDLLIVNEYNWVNNKKFELNLIENFLKGIIK